MVIFDASTLLMLLDPSLPAPIDKSTGNPIAGAERRIRHLVSSLHKDRTKIVIPSPVLAEVLTRSEKAGGDYLTKLDRSIAFKIEPFGTRAAVELARMNAAAIQRGDKRGGLSASWAEVKFDRQIVAVAKATSIKTLYSDDKNLRKLAESHDIEVIGTHELPLPPEDKQMNFAWEVHDEEESDDD